MKAVARILKPDDAVMELTLAMTVAEWKQVAEALPIKWPGFAVSSIIGQAIRGTIEHVETAREVTA